MLSKRPLNLILAVLFTLCLALSGVAQKTVHVKTYVRKDGTVVAAHDRSAPKKTSSSSSSTTTSTKTTVPRVSTTSTRERCVTCTRESNGKIKRSESAKRDFTLTHPCPATGRTNGPCPGYVIDHVNPLACGGPDAPSNMQWQTKEAAKAKDKRERNGCR